MKFKIQGMVYAKTLTASDNLTMQWKITSHHTNGDKYDGTYGYALGFSAGDEIGYDIDDFGTFDFTISAPSQVPSASIECPTCTPTTRIGNGQQVTLTVKFTLDSAFVAATDVLRLDMPVSNEAYSNIAGIPAVRMSSDKNLYLVNGVKPKSVTVESASGFIPDIIVFELNSGLTAGTEYSLVYTEYFAPPIKKPLTGIAIAHYLKKASSNICPVLPSGCVITEFVSTTDIDVSGLVQGSLTDTSVAITVG